MSRCCGQEKENTQVFIAGGIASKKVKHFLFSSVLGSTDTFRILLFGNDEVQVRSKQRRMTRERAGAGVAGMEKVPSSI